MDFTNTGMAAQEVIEYDFTTANPNGTTSNAGGDGVDTNNADESRVAVDTGDEGSVDENVHNMVDVYVAPNISTYEHTVQRMTSTRNDEDDYHHINEICDILKEIRRRLQESETSKEDLQYAVRILQHDKAKLQKLVASLQNKYTRAKQRLSSKSTRVAQLHGQVKTAERAIRSIHDDYAIVYNTITNIREVADSIQPTLYDDDNGTYQLRDFIERILAMTDDMVVRKQTSSTQTAPLPELPDIVPEDNVHVQANTPEQTKTLNAVDVASASTSKPGCFSLSSDIHKADTTGIVTGTIGSANVEFAGNVSPQKLMTNIKDDSRPQRSDVIEHKQKRSPPVNLQQPLSKRKRSELASSKHDEPAKDTMKPGRTATDYNITIAPTRTEVPFMSYVSKRGYRPPKTINFPTTPPPFVYEPVHVTTLAELPPDHDMVIHVPTTEHLIQEYIKQRPIAPNGFKTLQMWLWYSLHKQAFAQPSSNYRNPQG